MPSATPPPAGPLGSARGCPSRRRSHRSERAFHSIEKPPIAHGSTATRRAVSLSVIIAQAALPDGCGQERQRIPSGLGSARGFLLGLLALLHLLQDELVGQVVLIDVGDVRDG